MTMEVSMKISIPHGRRAATGAALALLAIGGVGAVTAASSGASTPPPTSNTAVVSTDTGPNVQQGDQSGPDTGTAPEGATTPEGATALAPAGAGTAKTIGAVTGKPASGTDPDNVQLQQGDQNGPDTATSGAGAEN
jgi:hypothetical protein